jgi:hypothetical protein
VILRLPILISSLLLAPVADTVWWRTPGGNVTQHREQDTSTCTLDINNGQGGFAFVWDHEQPTRVIAAQEGWRLASNQITTISMRIGDVWLEDGNGAPNIMAMTGPSEFKFIVNQPIDDLLVSADEIAIRTPESQFAVYMPVSKMKALVTALHRCRASASR